MAQENRHLMTEQLSAYLDEQPLSAEEQSQLDAHLKTCEQCQQELANLRQTVALLHALPQPALPRSFVLPLDIDIQSISTSIEDEEEAKPVPIALAAARRRRQEAGTGKRRWPAYVRTTLRTISTIAAVIGFALFLSGALTSFSHNGVPTASYSPSKPMDANNAQVKSSSSESQGSAAPQLSPSSRATITPPAATRATPTIAAAREEKPDVKAHSAVSMAAEPTRSPMILFFDLSTGPGRLGFGFLLLLLGVMGYVVFKQPWRHERA